MTVIKRPVITEKYSQQGESLNKYAFIVERKATKEQIKKEIEALYGVKVISINTMVYQGKKKTRYTKRNILEGRTRSYKKAVVTLKEGDVIDFYSNI